MKLTPRYAVTRDDETHIYTIAFEGKTTIVPGTTGILDIVGSRDRQNRLMGWAKKSALLKVAEHIRTFAGQSLTVDEAWIEAVRKSAWKRDKELLKEAGDLGKKVHEAIDLYIEGEPCELDEQTKPGFDNFVKWQKEAGIELIKGDTFIGSLEYGFGGALDALGIKDKKLVLLDWKTGNSVYDSASLQAAAYSIAFKETYGKVINHAFVVRLGKETAGDIEPKEVDLAAAYPAFLTALSLHKAMTASLWKDPVKAAK